MTPGRKPSMRTSAFSTIRKQRSTAGRFLEVEHKRALPAIDRRIGYPEELRFAGALDAQHIRAEVGKQHSAIGGRAKPGNSSDADAR